MKAANTASSRLTLDFISTGSQTTVSHSAHPLPLLLNAAVVRAGVWARRSPRFTSGSDT